MDMIDKMLDHFLLSKQLVDDMLGATQLGLDFGKDSAFCGVECEVDRAAKQRNTKWTVQRSNEIRSEPRSGAIGIYRVV